MKHFTIFLLCLCASLLLWVESKAQITKLNDYQNNYSATIGTFHGVTFREAGFSGLCPIPGTNGKEFWTVSDRGVNIDATTNTNATAVGAPCVPTYDKLYAFPAYAPKIHRIRINGDSIQILHTITIKRPDGVTTATGIINPTGLGSTATEEASTDVVTDCADFSTKIAAKDIWGIDSEGIVVDKDGNFWICEEGGPTIWKVNPSGKVLKRFTPYANLSGPLAPQAQDVAIDTVFKYRKNNRGFEGIAMTPNGKIYAIIQSAILYPNIATGEASRVHRIVEIDPATNVTKMYVYLNEPEFVNGAAANTIRLRDWKVGDMVAINNTEFLVMEAGARGTSDVKKVFKINLTGATEITSAVTGYTGTAGLTSVESLVTNTANYLAANGIVPVTKTLFMDLLVNNWPAALDKAEGIAILNDSTIAICNDNDYGQSSPTANGLPTATGKLSHLITYRLQGANKLTNFSPLLLTYEPGQTGLSTAKTPYLKSSIAGGKFTSIISAGDKVGTYTMAGIPDGAGAFDNGNGTFTMLVNHEIPNNAGGMRAHGSIGAFVSKWVINKSDLSVVSGSDLIQTVYNWNTGTSTYTTGTTAFNRFCSADLPPVSAFYNSVTGAGTQERIFMNGEEGNAEGRAMGHIVTGASAGSSYELPYLGKFAWENSVACPYRQDKTIVAGMDDGTGGQVYFYIGTKTTTGTDIVKAGLNGGKLYGVAVTGLLTETSGSTPADNSAFTLFDHGTVQNMTGATLNTNSVNAGVTTFLRPEDGAWDPSNPRDFYFVTTNDISSPTRLWRLRFTDIENPELGGTITAVLNGTEGQKMLDNMAIDNSGHVLLQEDVGGNAHIGKVWQYTISTDQMTAVAYHDSTRFLTGAVNFLTQDEEGSGIIDAQEILGPGMFLTVDQSHNSISGEVYQDGQILAFYNPATANANPEVNVQGNSTNIQNDDITPATADNTDFGSIATGTTTTKTFTILNAGPGSLVFTRASFGGTNASEFTLMNPPTFPLSIASGASQVITVKFAPLADGVRTAKILLNNTDLNEGTYTFSLQGTATAATSVESSNTLASSLKLYPNPAGDVAVILMTLEKEEKVVVKVYDAQGKEVLAPMEKNLGRGEQQILLNTSNLKNGNYNVQIIAGEKTTFIKTIVAH